MLFVVCVFLHTCWVAWVGWGGARTRYVCMCVVCFLCVVVRVCLKVFRVCLCMFYLFYRLDFMFYFILFFSDEKATEVACPDVNAGGSQRPRQPGFNLDCLRQPQRVLHSAHVLPGQRRFW